MAKDQRRGVGSVGIEVEGAGWKEGSGIGSCEKSGEKSGVDADKDLPFVLRREWG